MLQYTGGTTGTPKGAMLTHANVSVNCQQGAAWAPNLVPGQERTLAALPFFHVFAMTAVMNFALAQGAEIVIMPRFVLDDAMALITKTKPTVMPGVPTMFIAMLNHPKLQSFDLSSLKFCLSGGAPLPVEVKEKFERLTGCKVVEGYGLSEASPSVTCNPVDGPVKEGSIGQPLPGTIVSLRDLADPTKEVVLGEKGEICIKGPQVMKGYWKRPEETANQFVGEYLRTGDVGIMDDEGFIFIVDRIKDLIICSGYNVYPRRIEEAIYEHPAVEEVTVIGIKDEYRGEAPKAFVKLKAGGPGHRGGHLQAPGAQDLQDRDARRDRVPRRIAQDHDRQALQEGAESRGSRAPKSQGQMSARQQQSRPKQPAASPPGEPPERLYTIGELADELKVTTRAIRFYEAKGLIAPARRGVARSYSRRDRARLRLILRGKNLGFTLEEIAQYLTLYDADPTQMAQTQMLFARVETAIDDLQTKRADLDRTLRELKEIRAQCAAHLKSRGAGGRPGCPVRPSSVQRPDCGRTVSTKRLRGAGRCAMRRSSLRTRAARGAFALPVRAAGDDPGAASPAAAGGGSV